MDLQEVKALLTAESLALLAEIADPTSKDDVVRVVSRLRKAGHPPERVHAVMNQVALRKGARAKFGPFADRLLLTPEGLEQATRLEVASHHAGRFAKAGIASVADCGCGIGGDALAFAGLGIRVVAIDTDAVTAALATYNLAPFDSVTVERGDVTERTYDDVEGLWIDPARREGKSRLSKPEDWQPSLDWTFARALELPTGIKLGPGMDRDLIPEGYEAQWVSHNGTVVELVLWSGVLARTGITRSALVMNSRGSEEISAAADSPDQAVGELAEFIYEPDGAVIRARLIGDLARRLDATMMDRTIAYFTSATKHTSPLVQGFTIRETAPYTLKNLQRLVSAAQLGRVEIKKRGIDVDPAELRNSLKLEGTEEATLILTRVKGEKTAILADRLDSVGQDIAAAD
jgi:hypothetical protein